MRYGVIAASALAAAACGPRAPTRPERVGPLAGTVPAAFVHSGYARAVAFVGQPIAVPAAPSTAPVTITPALPPGVTLDPATGAIAGAASAPVEGTYRIADATGTQRMFVLAVIATPTDADRFVATAGDDAAAGDRDHPFRTIARALAGAAPGTRIFLHAGRYHEDVLIQDLRGDADHPYVIRSVPGELAVIDGNQVAVNWDKPADADAAPDEWVSEQSFPRADPDDTINRGVFVDREPYTRLLTYSRLEDLRAANQRWAINDDSLPGAMMPKGKKVAWVYMGPGVFHDKVTGRLHLRLSPTTNHVPGLADYDGPRDPSQVALALWARGSAPVTIRRVSYVEMRDLRLVGGGDTTAQVHASEHVTFDHVELYATTTGLTIGESSDIQFVNGVIDGGIPTWVFRSDFKDVYKIQNADGTVDRNNQVRKTQRTLMYVSNGSHHIEIAYSELGNGHDIYFAGIDSELHHCRIGPIQDEALYINHVKDIGNLRIHHNVYTRVVSGISSAGKPSGARYFYRNIYDLRDPTASYRPGETPKGVWRWGHVFKGNLSSAPFYFYHNTILVRSNKPGQPVLLHYQVLGKPDATPQPRWFADNVVVVAGTDAAPFAFVPGDEYRSATDDHGRPLMLSDGNAWVRAGASSLPMFRCIAGSRHATCASPRWWNLAEVKATGFEAHSRTAGSSGFVRMASADSVAADDDLRPGADSPAVGAAIDLPADLPDEPLGATPDAGALGTGAPPLAIGVDGRDVY